MKRWLSVAVALVAPGCVCVEAPSFHPPACPPAPAVVRGCGEVAPERTYPAPPPPFVHSEPPPPPAPALTPPPPTPPPVLEAPEPLAVPRIKPQSRPTKWKPARTVRPV